MIPDEAATCRHCGHTERGDDAQVVQDELAYHEDRCPENPENQTNAT